ncbi:MAG: saccharopine dehydrogenase family protein [Planctomycetota bacterium]
MTKVHWLGAGLSSVPGIRKLANSCDLILWNRTLEKAEAALVGIEGATAKKLDWPELESAVDEGDVIVSMLPATMHLKVAQICLDHRCHFVSSSYVSDEMQNLDGQAKELDLCFINEVGLDPGLDHLLAHQLIDEYVSSEDFSPENSHYFRSYCGGFPKIPNEFKYKFSWSPLGVLRALKSPAKWIESGVHQSTNEPWKSVKNYDARLPLGSETFQAYPNRDSLPFMNQYGIGKDWRVEEFIRGTLRLDGWTDAWSGIFDLVESLHNGDGKSVLESKSDELWKNYRYQPGEPDRVVLTVELKATREDETVWHQVYCLDECGNEQGSAMARLVSLTTSIAVDAVLQGKISAGVSAATDKRTLVDNWLQQMQEMGESFHQLTIV